MPLPFEPERFDPILAGETPPAIPWLVRDLMPKGTRLMWSSNPGVGKSLLALDLSLAVGSGQPFLGRDILTPGTVVYFDEENAMSFLCERLFKLARGRSIPKIDHFLSLFRLRMRGRPIDEWEKDIAVIAAELQPVLVVLDTFLWFTGLARPGKENDASLMGHVLSVLARTSRLSPGCTFLILHHLPKDPLSAGTPRGSSVIAGDVDGYWSLIKARGGNPKQGELHAVKMEPGKVRILDGVPTITTRCIHTPQSLTIQSASEV